MPSELMSCSWGLVAAQGGRAVQLALAHGDVGQVVLADGQNIRDDRGGAGLTVGRQSGTGDVQGGVPVGQGRTGDSVDRTEFFGQEDAVVHSHHAALRHIVIRPVAVLVGAVELDEDDLVVAVLIQVVHSVFGVGGAAEHLCQAVVVQGVGGQGVDGGESCQLMSSSRMESAPPWSWQTTTELMAVPLPSMTNAGA